MAITFVGAVSLDPASLPGTTAALDTTGATLLVASVGYWGGSGGSVSLSDSKGNTWTALTAWGSPGSARQQFFYCLAPTVGTGHTFSIAGSGSPDPTLNVVAFANVSSFQTEIGTGIGGSPASPRSTGSVTPSGDGALVFTGFGYTDPTVGTNSLTPAGFTVTTPTASGMGDALGYLVQATAAAINPTWAWTGTRGHVALATAVFLPPAPPAAAVRVTQAPVELVTLPTPAIAVTQAAVEVLGSSVAVFTTAVQVTQAPVETLSLPTPGLAVTQAAIEVLHRVGHWKLTIDGVDQTEKVVSCSMVWTINERARAQIVFKDYLPDRLVEVVVYARNGFTKLFGGVITARHFAAYTQAGPAFKLECDCGDFTTYLDWVSATGTYAAGPLKPILVDLVDRYLAVFGLVLDPMQATGPTVAAVTWAGIRTSDAMRELSDQTGWILRITPDKVLSMIAPATVPAPFVWSEFTSPSHVQEVDWRDHDTVPVNKIVLVCGPNGLMSIAEERHWGNGVTRIFELNSPFVSIIGALRRGDADGLDPGGWGVGTYGVDDTEYTYDASINSIHQRADQPIVTADQYIEVWYEAQFPFTVEATTGATPVIERREAHTDLLSIPAAQAIADQMLEELSADPAEIHGTADEDGYEVGQVLTLDLAAMRHLAGPFTIRMVQIDLVLLSYWRYTIEATEGLGRPTGSHLVQWRDMIGQGRAIPGPWSGTDVVTRAGQQTAASPIITAGVAAALGGPAYLGGTRERGTIRTNPAAWVPVIDYVEFVSGVTFAGFVRAELWTDKANVTARARLWNSTDGRSVGESAPVTSDVPVHVLFPVAIEFGKRYRLEVIASTPNEIVRCIGVLEAT